MTVAYFDASALVKLVIDEEGSDDAARRWIWLIIAGDLRPATTA